MSSLKSFNYSYNQTITIVITIFRVLHIFETIRMLEKASLIICIVVPITPSSFLPVNHLEVQIVTVD